MQDGAPASSSALATGTCVGPYVVGRVVGAGSSGTVHEAVHVAIDRRVALKVLSPRASADPDAVARFTAEARVVNRIRHPGIVDAFDLGVLPDGRHYLVMELLEGETLRARLDRGLPERAEALRLLRGIAAALDAAHDVGVAHRDLKPENVMLVRGEPRLIDFGLAKLVGPALSTTASTSGALIGTPRYMSPEQCRGREVDGRADVYAFGLLAFELLSGSPPFEAGDPLELMMKHAEAPPPRLSSRAPGFPAAADAVIGSALEKRPERRQDRAGIVVAQLEAALARPVRTPSRRRLAAGLIVLAAAAAGVIVLGTGESAPEVEPPVPPARPVAPVLPAAAAPEPSPPESAPPPAPRQRKRPPGPEDLENPYR